MAKLYPLRFEPLFRRYLWGGRRLNSVLGKELGQGDDFAESWELVDHGRDQSVVAGGPLRGTKLRQIVAEHGPELFGRHHPQAAFPLLFKFLDANRDLSVQVHPNDDQAKRLTPPDLGKTEAWVILHAEPGSVVYAGLKAGVARADLQAAVASGETAACLHCIEPQPGDCLFIPACTVHALGAGLVVAEIQQASDTTFRLFDWNRVGPDGEPRPLHVQQALEVIDFQRGPIAMQIPQPLADGIGDRLVACDQFVLDRRRIHGEVDFSGDERFHIFSVLEGELTVAGDPSGRPLTRGQTLLLPAAVGRCWLHAAEPAIVLDMFLPDHETLCRDG